MSARDELLRAILGTRHMTALHLQVPADIVEHVASGIADAILAEFVLVRRSELPETFNGVRGNGICTALAQEFYQPQLRFMPEDGDKPGDWNRRIAYANLAVALAIEGEA